MPLKKATTFTATAKLDLATEQLPSHQLAKTR
jgi:hypothetical protein